MSTIYCKPNIGSCFCVVFLSNSGDYDCGMLVLQVVAIGNPGTCHGSQI